MKTISKLTLLAIAFVAALSLHSCKKDGDGPDSSSKAKLLTAGTWKLQKIERQQKSDGAWVDYPLEDGIEITMSFKDDKTVVAVSPTESVVRGWVLSGDLTQLTLASPDGDTDTFTVLELTGSRLVISPLGFRSTVYSTERDTFSH